MFLTTAKIYSKCKAIASFNQKI